MIIYASLDLRQIVFDPEIIMNHIELRISVRFMFEFHILIVFMSRNLVEAY